jgi:CheY-like chemotaxis protein
MSARPLILIVEDNASNQLLVREILEPTGYEIEVASTSNQALELLDSMTPALILMDMELPGRDGLSLTRLLKSMSSTSGIPVVAMTGHTSLRWREDARAAGCAGFISKPIVVHTLPARVSEFLAAASQLQWSEDSLTG